MAQSARTFGQILKRWRARASWALTSDKTFLENAYREILGREIDRDGLTYYRKILANGESRNAVLISLVRSEEFTRALAPSTQRVRLRALRPEAYRLAEDRLTGTPILVFDVRESGDFDWLERAILDNGYYEQAGVWTLEEDTDKRVMAELLAHLTSGRALEIGCSSGAVVAGLRERGVDARGVEISATAIAHAPAALRPFVVEGDLLSVPVQGPFDVVYGLDVFEHLNPNRLDAYLARIDGLLSPGGYVFANVPSFGTDPVFGTVFPLYVEGWDADARKGTPFRRLHVDDDGYPLHGHLVWADVAWWTGRFSARGWERDLVVEEALHEKYDAYFEAHSPARKAFFVYRKGDAPPRSRAVADVIRAGKSVVLAT